jgi:hypothetical protein
MRRLCGCSVLVLVLACGTKAPEAPVEPPPAPPPTFADFAGTWDALNTLEGTADPVPSRITSTPAGGGWAMKLESRELVPMRASMSGDSLVLLSEPYSSVLRKNVVVQVRTAAVLKDGVMEGRLVATYNAPGGQELVTGTMRATKVAPTP